MVNSPIPVHRRRYSNEIKKHFREKIFEEKSEGPCRFTNVELFMNSSNGTLYSATDRSTDAQVILKKIVPNKSSMMKMDKELVPAEIYFHFEAFKACPEHVVEPLSYYKEGQNFILAMDRPEGYADLLEVAQKYAPIDENASFKVAKQLTQACQILRKSGIIHGDIKLENTLMNLKTLQVRLIDFGSALSEKTIEKEFRQPPSTRRYLPPDSSYKIDETTVWQIGAIMYILLVGEWCYDEDFGWTRDRESEEHLSSMAVFMIEQALNIKSCLRISSEALILMLEKL